MVAQDGAFHKSMELFEAILCRMEQGATKGQRLSVMEERLHGELQELGQLLLQEYIDAQGTGDLGPTVIGAGRCVGWRKFMIVVW